MEDHPTLPQCHLTQKQPTTSPVSSHSGEHREGKFQSLFLVFVFKFQSILFLPSARSKPQNKRNRKGHRDTWSGAVRVPTISEDFPLRISSVNRRPGQTLEVRGVMIWAESEVTGWNVAPETRPRSLRGLVCVSTEFHVHECHR